MIQQKKDVENSSPVGSEFLFWSLNKINSNNILPVAMVP